MSHVRSSDGDVLGIATRGERTPAREPSQPTPRRSSTPESHPLNLPGTSSPTVEPLEAPVAPPQYPRYLPSLIAKTKHMLPIYHQDVLASNICRLNSSLCCIMHEMCTSRGSRSEGESRSCFTRTFTLCLYHPRDPLSITRKDDAIRRLRRRALPGHGIAISCNQSED